MVHKGHCGNGRETQWKCKKCFFAKMAQRRRLAEHHENNQKECTGTQTQCEDFLSLSNTTVDTLETQDKVSEQCAHQKMSRDELALLTPQEAATINNELGQVLSVWLES